jgi:hypothetical protein
VGKSELFFTWLLNLIDFKQILYETNNETNRITTDSYEWLISSPIYVYQVFNHMTIL